MRKKKEPVYETYEDYKIFQHDEEMEEDEEDYIWGLIKLCVMVGIGVIIGKIISPDDIFGMYVCAGIPVGLHFFNKVVQFNLYGNTSTVFMFWVFKFAISAGIGCFAIPIMLLWYFNNIVEQIQEKRRKRRR